QSLTLIRDPMSGVTREMNVFPDWSSWRTRPPPGPLRQFKLDGQEVAGDVDDPVQPPPPPLPNSCYDQPPPWPNLDRLVPPERVRPCLQHSVQGPPRPAPRESRRLQA